MPGFLIEPKLCLNKGIWLYYMQDIWMAAETGDWFPSLLFIRGLCIITCNIYYKILMRLFFFYCLLKKFTPKKHKCVIGGNVMQKRDSRVQKWHQKGKGHWNIKGHKASYQFEPIRGSEMQEKVGKLYYSVQSNNNCAFMS